MPCVSHMDEYDQAPRVPAYPSDQAIAHLPKLVCDVERSSDAGPTRKLMQLSPSTPGSANGLPCPKQPTFPVAGQCPYSTGMVVYCFLKDDGELVCLAMTVTLEGELNWIRSINTALSRFGSSFS